MKKRKLKKRIRELERICSETYQVVGVLAEDAGVFDTQRVERVLDNLAHTSRTHKNVLPFKSSNKDLI